MMLQNRTREDIICINQICQLPYQNRQIYRFKLSQNYHMAWQTQQQIGLLILGVIKLIIYLIFLGLYVVRINKLDKLASNNLQKDRSLKFRIVFVLLLVVLDIIHIILSYSDQNYFMHTNDSYSLIDVLGIIDLLLQLYIITREHKKKTRRSRSVVTMWIFMSIQEICVIIIVEIYCPNVGIIVPIFKVIVAVVLIVLTLLVQPPPEASLQEFKQTIREPFPLRKMSETSSKISTKDNQRIYIQFNKQFQISLLKDHYECSFKIAVYVYDKFHIITKSQSQFTQLSRQMIQMFPNSEIFSLKSMPRTNNAINIMKYGEERQKIYESFLINITKTDQFYTETLMNFLQIHSSQRAALQKHKGSILKKDTFNSDEEERSKRPFFHVSWRDQKIHVSNSQILDFFVNKTNNQIIAFHNKLVAQKKLKMQLISQETDESQLSHFIYRLANSKCYWRVFAEWMCLGTAIEDKVYNMFDFWNLGFHHLEMSVIGYETSFDKDNSLIYYYLLSIIKKNSGKEGMMLKKRFNDFVKLDRNIRKFVVAQNIKNVHIPSLPPKFSPFESKTSPNSRRVYFDAYIKDIIKIQGINHCIKLLQFLEIDSQLMGQDFFKFQETEENEGSSKLFESIKLQDLDFDKS